MTDPTAADSPPVSAPIPLTDKAARARRIDEFLSNPNARVRLSEDKWLTREDWPRVLTDLHPEIALVCIARLANPAATHEQLAQALQERVGVVFTAERIGEACKHAGFQTAIKELAALASGSTDMILDLASEPIARKVVHIILYGKSDDRVALDGGIAVLKGRGFLKGDAVLLPMGEEERKRLGKSIAEVLRLTDEKAEANGAVA